MTLSLKQGNLLSNWLLYLIHSPLKMLTTHLGTVTKFK
jgi:hypothetical protein